jgi:hypothetical protein
MTEDEVELFEPIPVDLSKSKVIGWYGLDGFHLEQWAIDEGFVVTDCPECEVHDDER